MSVTPATDAGVSPFDPIPIRWGKRVRQNNQQVQSAIVAMTGIPAETVGRVMEAYRDVAIEQIVETGRFTALGCFEIRTHVKRVKTTGEPVPQLMGEPSEAIQRLWAWRVRHPDPAYRVTRHNYAQMQTWRADHPDLEPAPVSPYWAGWPYALIHGPVRAQVDAFLAPVKPA